MQAVLGLRIPPPLPHAFVTTGPTLYPLALRYSTQSNASACAVLAVTIGTAPAAATTLSAANKRLTFMSCPSVSLSAGSSCTQPEDHVTKT